MAFPVDRGPAPIYGVDWRPSDDELAKLFEALPEQPLHLAVVLAGERERSGWWGDGRDAAWSDAIGVVRRLADELGVERDGRRRPRGCPGTPAAARGSRWAEQELGHAGELHPRVCAAFGLPARTVRRRDRPRLPAAARAATWSPGPEFSTYPVAKEDVALVVDDSVRAADVEAPCARAPGSCSSRSGSSTLHRRRRSASGRKSLAFALRFRAPDRTLTEQETGAARDAAVALAAERRGAVQR